MEKKSIIYKIDSKYCDSDGCQVMFTNASSQIVFSKEGISYLKDGNALIHKYLNDSRRERFPYGEQPVSGNHTSHFLKFGQLYGKFTSKRTFDNSLFDKPSSVGIDSGGYSLSFLYPEYNSVGNPIIKEWIVFDGETFYEKYDNETKYMTRQELEIFLYDVDNNEQKYIFDFDKGIMFANSKADNININRKFVDLSDDNIISTYNIGKKLASSLGAAFGYSEITNSDSLIHEITNVRFTPIFTHPVMITVKGNEMNFYALDIEYLVNGLFKLNLNKIKIDSKLDRMDCRDSIKFSCTEIEPRFLNNVFTKKLKR